MRLVVALLLVLRASCQCPVCNQTGFLETFASFAVSESIKCPPHSSSRYVGATSADNCTCDVGFVKERNLCAEQAVSSGLDVAMWSGVAAGAAGLLGGGGLFSMGAFQSAAIVQPNMFIGVKITV